MSAFLKFRIRRLSRKLALARAEQSSLQFQLYLDSTVASAEAYSIGVRRSARLASKLRKLQAKAQK